MNLSLSMQTYQQQTPSYQQSQYQPPQQQYNYESPSYQQQQPPQQQQQYYQSQPQQQYQARDNFYRQPSPGVITLRKEAPVTQQSAPVYASQPAAHSFGGKYI